LTGVDAGDEMFSLLVLARMIELAHAASALAGPSL
jgi:hypothetical protein